jgi:O-antigen/teichoic acid export membrane protein
VIFAVAFDRTLLRLVYGAEFVQAAAVFEILVFQSVINKIAGQSSQYYLASNRAGLNSWTRVFELTVAAGSMLAWAPSHGASGAALGLLAGSCVRLLLLWAGFVTHLRVPLPRLWPGQDDLRLVRSLFRC